MYKNDKDDFFVCKEDYCEPVPKGFLEHTQNEETVYFEDLDEPIQEVIIDLLASILKNS